jgi:MFS transporter, DHA2 family, multidrug resistance protein
LCGLANSLAALVIFRIGQGLFGALIMPMGQAIVLATFPRTLHATVMVIWGFGRVVGPVVGSQMSAFASSPDPIQDAPPQPAHEMDGSRPDLSD